MARMRDAAVDLRCARGVPRFMWIYRWGAVVSLQEKEGLAGLCLDGKVQPMYNDGAEPNLSLSLLVFLCTPFSPLFRSLSPPFFVLFRVLSCLYFTPEECESWLSP